MTRATPASIKEHKETPVKRANQGFTLIELMIVVAVIGILSAIAYPSYMQYIRRGYRAEARTGLLQAQQYLERSSTAIGVYPTVLPTTLTSVNSNTYAISFAAGNTAAVFTLQAVPQGAQTGDQCGTYTLSNTGVRGDKGATDGQAGFDPDCWSK